MRSIQCASVVGCAILAAATWFAGAPEGSRASVRIAHAAPLVGDVATLHSGYERWWRARAERGEFDRLELALGWSKGRSVAYTEASGRARFELADERVTIEVAGFEGDEPLEAWLVAYRAGVGAGFDPRHDERSVWLGALAPRAGASQLSVTLPSELADGFELERVVVARAGAGPNAGGLLFASPSLFERLAYQSERSRQSGALPGGLPLAVAMRAPFTLHAVSPAAVDLTALEALVARGEQLFFEETFGGNGRTCGTCHPAENNTTLDPAYIATLPADDPLFVAETNPYLDARRNGGLVFENPVLLREQGLIVVNADGFGELRSRYTLRGVPHLLGLVRTTTPAPDAPGPLARLGWAGDGAPGLGSLREFAAGAIAQHLPRTLARRAGVDYRLPTSDELTALEAFELSLGSPVNPDLSALRLLDPAAEAGRALFQHRDGACFMCHFDAGAFRFGRVYNSSLDTGVEAFTHGHPDGSGELRPPDGGFGLAPEGGNAHPQPNPDGSYGNGRFAIQSVIEAADTLPAFHSNLTRLPGLPFGDTIEGAVAFYDSEEFAAAPGIGAHTAIDLDDVQIARLGAFLRALNALENERAARSRGERALEELAALAPQLERVARLAERAALECEDGAEVLGGVGMNPLARGSFDEARRRFENARSGTLIHRRAERVAALERLAAARADVALE